MVQGLPQFPLAAFSHFPLAEFPACRVSQHLPLPLPLFLPELRGGDGEEDDDPMLTWDPEEDTRVLLHEGMVGTTAFMAPET